MATAAAVKLSPALKALIAAPHARGEALAAPARQVTNALFDRLRGRGEAGGVGRETWLSVGSAVLFTVNSPDAVTALYNYAAEGEGVAGKVEVAVIMREIGLKCISFNGIPKTINNLNFLYDHLSADVQAGLSKEPQRQPHDIAALYKRGLGLWDGIYEPHSAKLIAKLSASHPDLAVHILNSHYGPLLSDPAGPALPGAFKLGRVLTSVVAIAALRAQTGVGPQVTSHVFGLKKALLPGGGGEGSTLQGQEWLTSDEGVTWVLESVDDATAVIRDGATRNRAASL
ncbi:Dol-P-Man:Man(5)GlcNAc(2)-PP-Dol alpha-1,3-mannosyltransferase [Vanrija pseudolonga]|uniref:Dol-P-Man:Man(5)GlcNAc(2)-PP-Dol alpha-1,3-mannosyltransferase n=1 Tax=Vanrija pseudolonga TaxID=143232 RepID=A0AAF0Y5A1_9TREE|nr:Dol-P-Man:Man(5)GlcNAc(2)-PP-Dol alpha-1,3-mannosyltransferase [Vanrija pseudolonga]